MKLRLKTLSGVVSPYHKMDQILKSQGFRSSHNQPPVYYMKIRDLASGLVYRLTLPTTLKNKDASGKYLTFEFPSLEPQLPFAKRQGRDMVPESVITAACEKIEEIVSYLKS